MKHRELVETVDAIQLWIADNTKINPDRARQAVLDTLVWCWGEAELQEQTISWLLSHCAPVSYSSNKWAERRYRGQSRKELAPDTQRRAHCIGRAQPPGDNSPKWWYVVPPEIQPKTHPGQIEIERVVHKASTESEGS